MSSLALLLPSGAVALAGLVVFASGGLVLERRPAPTAAGRVLLHLGIDVVYVALLVGAFDPAQLNGLGGLLLVIGYYFLVRFLTALEGRLRRRADSAAGGGTGGSDDRGPDDAGGHWRRVAARER